MMNSVTYSSEKLQNFKEVYLFINKYVSITTDFYTCDTTFSVLIISCTKCHAAYAILTINTDTYNYKYSYVAFWKCASLLFRPRYFTIK
jgi:hypothetical protein